MKALFLILGVIFMSNQSFAANDKAEITEVIKTYEKALNGNDVPAIMKLYAEKPIFMPQHAPAQIGTEAVENAYKGVFKALDLDIKFEIYEIEAMGNTAWARTSSAGKTKILANNAIVSEGNNELFVFKKEKGMWKIHRYLFSTNQPRQ
ncbi:MAG: nuclear transport factor 2 family protein [Bacteriovoracaceae bacterium]|nr:nuclear transport factor 2 family protein [Bacteriovoracaceae bacterium]